MNDLISRSWLIKQLETEKEYRANRGEVGAEKGLCYALEIVDDMPSAQEWIPCSERLPEAGHSVLIFVDDGYVAEGCKTVDNTWVQYRWSTVLSADKIIAWMPLPEPPKESNNETNRC